jgi:hypothetical protein
LDLERLVTPFKIAADRTRQLPRSKQTNSPIPAVAVITDAVAALQQADNEIWWPGIGAPGVKAKSSPSMHSAAGCGL